MEPRIVLKRLTPAEIALYTNSTIPSIPSREGEQGQSQMKDLSAEEERELEEACQVAERMKVQPQVAADNLDWGDNMEIDDAALIKACEEGEKKAAVFSILDRTLAEDLICCICTDLLHECVSIFPCTHCFCGSCLSKWVYEQRRLSCPKCRGPLDPGNVRPFPQIVGMVERLLQKQPDLQTRTKAELDEMSRTNRFKHANTSDRVSLAPARPRRLSYLSDLAELLSDEYGNDYDYYDDDYY